jgi:hypothetical protein
MFIKNLLKDIVAFLERKFPDRIEITLQEYKEMREELGALNKAVQGILVIDAAQKRLEKDLELVKSNLGYIGTKNAIRPLER